MSVTRDGGAAAPALVPAASVGSFSVFHQQPVNEQHRGLVSRLRLGVVLAPPA